MPRASRSSRQSSRQSSRRSRLPVDVKIGGPVDQNAIDEYMANHKLNPRRYKLPKQRRAKVDLGARSKHWDQGLTDMERAKFRQVGMPAEAAEQAVRDTETPKREVLARDAVPRNFNECAALNDGVVMQSYPAQCIFNNMNFIQGKDFYYDEKGQLRKVKKRVRFVKSQVQDGVEEEGDDVDSYLDDEMNAAKRDEEGEGEEEEEEEDDASRNFLEQVGFDLKNTFNDLSHFDEVPGKTSMEKMRYTFAKDTSRVWSVTGTIVVFVLIICLLGSFFYFSQNNDTTTQFVGGAEFTPNNFGFTRYPLIGMGD
jgi:hypothetical protein